MFELKFGRFGSRKTKFSYGMYCKSPLFTEFVFQGFGVDFYSLLEALGAVFLVFGALEGGLNIEFDGCQG